MIKYHVIGLLCLAVAAIAGIEAAARFYEAHLKQAGQWYTSWLGWLMVLLTGLSLAVYFRARKLRKIEAYKRGSKN